MYIQSTAGFSCMEPHATGIVDSSGGRSPASIRATRQDGSSERRDAMTAPADPPPTTMKSNVSGTFPLPGLLWLSTKAFRRSSMISKDAGPEGS